MAERPPYGRRAADRTDDWLSIDERRLRAVAEPLDVSAIALDPYPQLEVRNPVRHTQYLVLFPGSPEREPGLCTCTDFARRGLGNCKHLEAAWRWLRGRPRESCAEPTPEPADDRTWAEIDRRLALPPPPAKRDIRGLSAVGAVLFERASDAGTTDPVAQE